jgi:hypothetical protein
MSICDVDKKSVSRELDDEYSFPYQISKDDRRII